MSNPRLQVDIGANTKDLDSKLKGVEGRLKSFSRKMGQVGGMLTTRLTLPLATVGFTAIKLASDLEESLNKVDVSFGDSANEVKKFADTTLESFGIARGSALDMASLFGDMATSMGLSTSEASNMSTSLVGLAGDLASFKNVQIDVAKTALAGIFTGETESLKQLGYVMTEVNLEAFALSRGITKNIKDMSQAEKVNLRYAYIMDKARNAQGDFARTFDSSANQMKVFQQSLKQLGEQFGKEMLPAFTEAVTGANNLIKRFSALDSETKKQIATYGAIATAVGPVLLGFSALINSVFTLTKNFRVLFGLMRAHPLALVATALVGLSAEALIASKNFKDLKKEMEGVAESGGEGKSLDEINQLIVTQTRRIEELKKNFRGTTADAVDAHLGQVREAEKLLETYIKIRDNKAQEELTQKINTTTEATKELNEQLDKVAKPRVAQKAPIDVLLLDGLGLDDNTNLTLEELADNWSNLNFLTGELPVKISEAQKVADAFTESFAQGLADVIAYGDSVGDMLKDLARMILREGIYRILLALFTGGGSLATSTATSFGSGLLSGIGNIFGMAGSPLSMGKLPPMGSATEVTGRFEIKGSDLVTVLSNANTRTLR